MVNTVKSKSDDVAQYIMRGQGGRHLAALGGVPLPPRAAHDVPLGVLLVADVHVPARVTPQLRAVAVEHLRLARARHRDELVSGRAEA
eukprot:1867575-Pyramimonas_sp.AAC.2